MQYNPLFLRFTPPIFINQKEKKKQINPGRSYRMVDSGCGVGDWLETSLSSKSDELTFSIVLTVFQMSKFLDFMLNSTLKHTVLMISNKSISLHNLGNNYEKSNIFLVSSRGILCQNQAYNIAEYLPSTWPNHWTLTYITPWN